MLLQKTGKINEITTETHSAVENGSFSMAFAVGNSWKHESRVEYDNGISWHNGPQKTTHNYSRQLLLLHGEKKVTDNFYELSIEIYVQRYIFHIDNECISRIESLKKATYQYNVVLILSDIKGR